MFYFSLDFFISFYYITLSLLIHFILLSGGYLLTEEKKQALKRRIQERKFVRDMTTAGQSFDTKDTVLDEPRKVAERDHRFSETTIQNELKNLNERHLEVVRLTAMGLKPSITARAMGISPVTVRNILRSDIAKSRMKQILALRDKHAQEISAEIQLGMGDALDTAYQIMTNGRSEDTKLRAAFGWMDRGGFGPVRKLEKKERGVITHVLSEIKTRARKLGVLVNNEIEEVTYEEDKSCISSVVPAS
jgi:DNA-binding CsgD family transcriptional regulator